MEFQDRILYGTDLGAAGTDNPLDIKEKAHQVWIRDWRYFNSDDVLESAFVNDQFRGLMLPRSVIDKIYYENAIKWYSGSAGNYFALPSI